MEPTAAHLDALEAGPLYSFADWGRASIPERSPGVYTVWRGDEFIYAGMSYMGSSPKALGLTGRLDSHASGARSGDQFNIYICDRFVLPTLTKAQITEVAAGTLSLNRMTREYIRERLSYRYVLVKTGVEARNLEHPVRRGLPRSGKPFLNPL